MFRNTGVTRDSRQVVEQAISIVGPNAELTTALINLDVVERSYATALVRVDTLVEIDQPDVRIGSADHQFMYGHIYWELNRLDLARSYLDSARATYERLRSDYPENPIPQQALGIIYAYLGRKGDAVNAGERAAELLPVSSDAMEGAWHEQSLAWVYTIVGEYELAIDKLEYLMSIPSTVSLTVLIKDPVYDPIRAHPRFQALIEKYENKHGT
jgi:tetratricopeptide (TPR) repeat protein